MCAECPVEVNERVIRSFVRVMNENVSKAKPEDLPYAALAVTIVAESHGIALNPSDPDVSPITLNPTYFNASLCFILTENGYQEANG